MEANMQVLEGAQYRLRVKLINAAGEQLPPELFLVYAGAFCPGYAPAHFHAERTPEEWVLTMPGLKAGRVPWNWQIIAAEYATGVEWVLAAGEVTVTPRYAGCSGHVDPDEVEIVAALDKTTQQMTVQVGESTAACSLAVVAAQNSAKAADASAKEAANSAEHAAEQAQAAETARKHADGSATNAAVSAADAHVSATAANTSATDAANRAREAAASAELASAHATEAAGCATNAAARAADAATSSKVAAGAASDALEARTAAVSAAEIADARMVAAQDAAADAEAAREGADAAAVQALAGASAAAESASAAAESASALGDAALKSQNNTFTGKNVFNGALSGSGTLFGVPMARWMGLSEIFSKTALTDAQFKLFFPEWETAEVWPYVDTSQWSYERISAGDDPKKGARYGFFTGAGWMTPEIGGAFEEMWYYMGGNPWMVVFLCRGLQNYVFLPGYTGGHPFSFRLPGYKGVVKTTIYAPKWTDMQLTSDWSGYGANFVITHEITLACNPAPCKKLTIKGSYDLTLKNANFSNCTQVSVTTTRIDKETILAILNTLPAYDAETMTTVPTCTLYVNPEYEGDEKIVNALLNLQTSVEEGGKGWTVAVSGISLTGAATYGLRPTVYCKRWPESSGLYVDADGGRWEVSSGTIALRHGEANEQLGYEAFASVEEALTAWGLVEYVAPVPEGMERPESSEN